MSTTRRQHSDWLMELDGLRALAMLLVLIAHFNPWLDYIFPPIAAIKQLSLGNLGVMLFFTLSGFLITSLGLRDLQRYGNIRYVHFIVYRIFRIWPAYFFAVLLATIVTARWEFVPARPGASTTPE